ncbi:MAG TPA: hypothetical protein ENK19_11775, partial [Acidobacteria bacterium]|nr:hypothetical protein [Acidobacteriota bacterium]
RASTEKRLANESFVSRAPAEVVEGARRQLEETVTRLAKLRATVEALGR